MPVPVPVPGAPRPPTASRSPGGPPYPFVSERSGRPDLARMRALAAAAAHAQVTHAPVRARPPGGRPLRPLVLVLPAADGAPPAAARVTVLQSPWAAHAELNALTDWFSERCRTRCRFGAGPTPLAYWRAHGARLAAQAAASGEDVRELMYRSVRMCNNFRISVAVYVLRLFRARRWLDISAGWGDRLLAALLTEGVETYCSVDPNPCLHPAYRDMVAWGQGQGLGPGQGQGGRSRSRSRGGAGAGGQQRQRKFVLIEDGFERATLPAGDTYDLVFTSPPFFTLEIYSDAPADSVVAHAAAARANPAAAAQAWLHGFLLPSLRKAASRLELGGHVVLYLADAPGARYLDAARRAMTHPDSGLVDCGSLYYEDGNALREFFVWRKLRPGRGAWLGPAVVTRVKAA